MSSAPDASNESAAEGAAANKGGGKRKLILLAVPLLLGGVGAGLWFSGILPKMLGKGGAAEADEHAQAAVNQDPVFVEVPEIIANLSGTSRRSSFVKLKARLEVSGSSEAARLQAAMPRLLDMFQTYIREMRPEELRGSGGTYRLREELIARAQIAAAPVRVRDVLFTEILIQ